MDRPEVEAVMTSIFDFHGADKVQRQERGRMYEEEHPPSSNTGQSEVRFLNPNLRHGFAQIPRPVLKAKGLGDKAKLLYCLLVDYAWNKDNCFPGQKRLAEELGASEITVRRALAELRDFGLIDWKQRGMTQTNVYYILDLVGNPHLDLE